MKNTLLLAVVKFLKRWIRPSLLSLPHKVLVVSSTALGDTLWATPAIESLRKTWPEASITVLTSPIGEEVLRHNPWTNQIIVIKEPLLRHFFRLWRQLKKEHFHEIVILHASQRLMLPLCSLLGAHKIIGSSGINKGLDILLTHSMPSINSHEIIRRLQLIKTIGASSHTEKLSFFLQSEEQVKRLKNKPRVALHPGSKDNFKQWPVEHFIQVGKKLIERGFEVALTGSMQESSLTQTIVDSIPTAIRLNPALTLRQFAAELVHFDLLISNDTGPVHLACALGVPVIALYSPTNPILCGPHQAKQAIPIAKATSCSPCLKRKCKRPFCLLQIGPEEVMAAVSKILTQVASRSSSIARCNGPSRDFLSSLREGLP